MHGSRSGDWSEEQESVANRPNKSGGDVAHLFLASSAEALHILHSLENARVPGAPPPPHRLLERLNVLAEKISAYAARNIEDLRLKTQILVALIDADLHDACPALTESIFDDAKLLCPPLANRSAGPPSYASALADLLFSQESTSHPVATSTPRSESQTASPKINVKFKEIDSLVQEMVATARKAMVSPTHLSLFADPVGSFCTAAAIVASVERVLRMQCGTDMSGLRVAVFGATGVVGLAASVIAALEGALVQIVAHRGVERLIETAAESKSRFGVDLEPASAETGAQKTEILRQAQVIFCAATSSARVIDADDLAQAKNLLVAVDINTVPPSGIEGIEPYMDGERLPSSAARGVGPFTVGNLKHRTEAMLLTQTISSGEPLSVSFGDVLRMARQLAV